MNGKLINNGSGIHGIYGRIYSDRDDVPEHISEGFFLTFEDKSFDDVIAQTETFLCHLKEAKKYCHKYPQEAFFIIQENE